MLRYEMMLRRRPTLAQKVILIPDIGDCIVNIFDDLLIFWRYQLSVDFFTETISRIR
jgi:hypothetical protein